MTATACLLAFWKGFLLGGLLGVVGLVGLLAIGACLGGARLQRGP